MLTRHSLRFLPLALVLPVLLFSACKKDDDVKEEDLIDFGPAPGFQYRTGSNLPTGSGDPTDWVADGPWNPREKQLFSALGLPLDAPQQTGTWYASVYPNQSEAASGFTFTTSVSANKPAPAGTRMMYVIVDSKYKELYRNDLLQNGVSMSFGPNTLAAGALYRLYYVCYVPGQQVYYRSHGDIKVE